MQLFEYDGSKRWEISKLDLSDGRPVLVHLGDHLRVRDIYIDAKFHDFIERIKGGADTRIVAPIIRNSSQDELLGRRLIFNRASGEPSNFAKEIYDVIYRPLIDKCCDLNDELQIAILRKSLSYLPISAYSYGTSLLQQIAHVMAGDISSRFGSSDEKRGLKAYDICRSVKAIAIGCTSRLRKIEPSGNTIPLRWDDFDFSNSHTVFSQMLFQMRHDKAIINALGGTDESIGGLYESETGIELRETLTAGQVIDYTPPPTIKRVGFVKDSQGRAHAKISCTVDPLVHGDSSYSYMHERQGDFVLSQTLAMTPLLRAASRAMLDPELDGRDWLNAMRSAFRDQDQRRALVACRDASQREFGLLISEVETSPETERVEMVQKHIDGFHTDTVAVARACLKEQFAANASLFAAIMESVGGISPKLRDELSDVARRGLGRIDRNNNFSQSSAANSSQFMLS